MSRRWGRKEEREESRGGQGNQEGEKARERSERKTKKEGGKEKEEQERREEGGRRAMRISHFLVGAGHFLFSRCFSGRALVPPRNASFSFLPACLGFFWHARFQRAPGAFLEGSQHCSPLKLRLNSLEASWKAASALKAGTNLQRVRNTLGGFAQSRRLNNPGAKLRFRRRNAGAR